MTATTEARRAVEFTPVEHTVEHVWTGFRARIEDKVAKMNKRLARFDAPAATVEFGPETTRIVEMFPDAYALYHDDGDTTYAERIGAIRVVPEFEWVTITGAAAKFDGWTPIASLDHTFHTEDGNDEAFVAMFPFAVENEIELPAPMRRIGNGCDHCGTDRRRKTTIVFRSDDGEYINVGTSCFRDFVGVTPATVLWLSESVTSPFGDDEFDSLPAEAYEPDVTAVLRVASALTDTFGFVRSREPGATKDAVMTVIDGRPTRMAREITETDGFAEAVAVAADKAEAIKTWVTEKAAANGSSDYFLNADLAIRANRAGHRTLGLLASLPFAYARAMGEIAEREAKAAAGADSVHIGEIGVKMVLTPVTIVKVIAVDTMYGTSRRVSGMTADGNLVTTFGSGSTLWDVEVDDLVEWRGTVKEHTTEYGVETSFGRVKLLTVATEADTTKVAAKGDIVKVTVSDETNTRFGLMDDRGVSEGWVFDADTNTLYAEVEKVGKRDGRFVYTLNTPVGLFKGADIVKVIDELPAWRMSDSELRHACRTGTYIPREESEEMIDAIARVRARDIRKWHTARNIELTDTEVDDLIARYDTLMEDEEA